MFQAINLDDDTAKQRIENEYSKTTRNIHFLLKKSEPLSSRGLTRVTSSSSCSSFPSSFSSSKVPNLEKFQHLQHLEICWNSNLVTFDELEKLSSLKHCNLNNTAMTLFPRELLSLVNLETLIVINNGSLKTVPSQISCLQKLKELNISDNKLICLPSSISLLTNLESIDVSRNSLKNKQLMKYCLVKQEIKSYLMELGCYFVGVEEVRRKTLLLMLIRTRRRNECGYFGLIPVELVKRVCMYMLEAIEEKHQ